jgi:hypothetical protein
VHLCCFRKADGLADQAFNARAQRQMLALDFLRVSFTCSELTSCSRNTNHQAALQAFAIFTFGIVSSPLFFEEIGLTI